MKENEQYIGFWVHDAPARSLEQVHSYLTGDAHDKSKVQYFDGHKWHDVGTWLHEQMS